VEKRAEEFAERYRGERPSLTEYTDKYPELAAEIRDVFPDCSRKVRRSDPTGCCLCSPSCPRPMQQCLEPAASRQEQKMVRAEAIEYAWFAVVASLRSLHAMHAMHALQADWGGCNECNVQ
jgi:hypothetical protein